MPADLTKESSSLALWLTESRGLGAEELVILNVVEMGPQVGFASDGFERMVAWKREAEKGLRELRQQVEATGIRCRWRLELGKPSREILRVAEEERVASIAMGSHGHGLMRRILRRSLTGAVLNGAACPVLIVPFAGGKRPVRERANPAAQLFRRVLLATDFSDAAEATVAVVKAVPAAEVAEVLVVTVCDSQTQRQDPPRQRLDRLAAELSYFGFTATCEALEGKLTTAVAQILRARDVSLIVIGAGSGRRPSGSHSASIAGAMRRASNRPLLVVPAVGA